MMQEFLTTVLPLSLPVSRAPNGAHISGPVFIHWGVYSMPAARIRFATKGEALCAMALASWPAVGKPKTTPLADVAVKSVSLMGHGGELDSACGSDGLTVIFPPQRPSGSHAFAFKTMQ